MILYFFTLKCNVYVQQILNITRIHPEKKEELNLLNQVKSTGSTKLSKCKEKFVFTKVIFCYRVFIFTWLFL